jgi:D-erythronate 2-dehydrogenase
MHTLVTGAGGFLGRLLIETLLAQTEATITALDVVPMGFASERVAAFVGDLSDAGWLAATLSQVAPIDQVYHLAAVVSGAAEADFDLGYRANLEGTRSVLEALRRQSASGGPVARLAFTSSVAVFGGTLPEVVTDGTVAAPQGSYGVQKLMSEYLIGDYTRKGFLDGRSVRLPTVSVRPGKPNAALSSFASGVIREPLQRKVSVLPVPRETAVWLISPDAAVAALRHTLTIEHAAFHQDGYGPAVNLPGLCVRVSEMLESLFEVGGPEALALVQDAPDPRVMKLVSTWPTKFAPERALSLGYRADESFTQIVRTFAQRL